MSEDTKATAHSTVSTKTRVTKEEYKQMKTRIIELETLQEKLENQNVEMMYKRFELFSCHTKAKDNLEEKEKIHGDYMREVEHYKERMESNPDNDATAHDCQEHIDESQCEMSLYNKEELIPAQEACNKAELELEEFDEIIDRARNELVSLQNELRPLVIVYDKIDASIKKKRMKKANGAKTKSV